MVGEIQIKDVYKKFPNTDPTKDDILALNGFSLDIKPGSFVSLIGPSKGILYGFAEPVTAAVIGTTLLGSPFTIWDAVGFLAVFLMLTLISVNGRKPSTQTSPGTGRS